MTKPNSALQAGGDETPVAWIEAEPNAARASLVEVMRGLTFSTCWHYQAARPTPRPGNVLFPVFDRPTPAAEPDMLAVCAALGFDPTNHHNAAKCPYCTPAAVAGVPTPTFQQRVEPWLLACFGADIAGDTEERNHRFLEESLELVQACGCTAGEAHQLVDYVFGRPVGEKHQEAGGVMITLAALCRAQGIDMHEAGEVELARIWTMVEKIRAKQAAKPKHSPLLASPVAPAGVLSDEQIDALWLYRKDLHDGDILAQIRDFARAVLSAGAPAVPLKDSVHSHLAAPGSTVPSAFTVGTPPSLLYEIMNLPAHPRDLPGTFSSGWISGHKEARHQAAELVRAALRAVPHQPVQSQGRDGVTDSGASSEAAEGTPSSSGPNGHGKDCA